MFLDNDVKVAGSVLFASSSPHVTVDVVQQIHYHLRPIALIAWLLVVQIRFAGHSQYLL